MKATPSVAKATASKQESPRIDGPVTAGQESDINSPGLSQEQIKARAFTSTQVMTEILEHDKNTYSFRHWGINE
jgi:hypothetical protein